MSYPGPVEFVESAGTGRKTLATYRVPVGVAELRSLLSDSLHGNSRLMLTELEPDSAVVQRRTTWAGRADRIELTFEPLDDGTLISATARGLYARGFDYGRYSGDLRLLFEVLRDRIAAHESAGG